jgi:heme oxygenase
MPIRPSHQALREGTRDAHEALDGLFARFDLSDAAGYAAFLSAHAQALLPLEAALDAAGADRVMPDWPARRRGALLIADLAALGIAPPAPGTVPPLDSPAAIAGALYVVEGSRLGGKFLARQVASDLSKHYLSPHQASGMWTKLLAQIDTLLYDASRQSIAIETARAVFATFEVAGRHWYRE